jgi:hypothetical protein
VYRNTTGVCLIATLRTTVLSATIASAASATTTPKSVSLARTGTANRTTFTSDKYNTDFKQSDAIKALEQFASAAAQRQLEETLHSQPNSDVFLRVELGELAKSQCVKLISHILETSGVRVNDESVLDSIYAVCGGSPLYATELARSLCEQYVNRENSTRGVFPTVNASTIEGMLANFRTERIEEIVYFRFDKQPASTQLVLKMAAVASINGYPFTLNMLYWVLHTSEELLPSSQKTGTVVFQADQKLGPTSNKNNSSDSRKSGLKLHYSAASTEEYEENADRRSATYDLDISQALEDLLQTEEFIMLAAQVDASTAEDSALSALLGIAPSTGDESESSYLNLSGSARIAARKNKEDGSEETINDMEKNCANLTYNTVDLRYVWKVDLEKRAVYDLLLDEQKESLHDRVVCQSL